MAEESPGQPDGLLARLAPGSVVAGYRLESQVGAGGMAVVFRARDERLDRLVALKVLAPALAADDGFRQRFIRESRAAAAVDDPHIIPVYEAGEADGVLFIAMRLVAGGDLRLVASREGALPPDRAGAFISPVASALDAAHRAGLVHRDVKPANVLVDAAAGRPDHVYLSDFGLSKGALSLAGLTGAGQFLGTPDYSAPEQISGRAVDGRADQYALACVAFTLLAGAPPFARDEPVAVLWAHLSEPPPTLTALRPDLPAAADQVLARALAKAPDDRYGSCLDFADALREALGVAPYASAATGPVSPPDQAGHPPASPVPGHPTTQTAQRPSGTPGYSGPGPVGTGPVGTGPIEARPAPGQHPRRRRVAVAALTTILLAAAAVFAAMLGNASSHKSPAAAGQSATPSRHTTGHRSTAPAKRATITLGATLTDPHGKSVNSVAFSPDGKTLAVGDANGRIYVWGAATGASIATLTSPGNVRTVAFSPDGKTLAVAGASGSSTYLWDMATRTLSATLADPDNIYIISTAFSPDGKTLAVGDDGGTIYLWDVATGTLSATLTNPSGNLQVAFSPDGKTLAVGAADGRTYLWDVATRTLSATLTDPGSAGGVMVAISPDGKTLASGDNNGSPHLWDMATRTLSATLAAPGGQFLFQDVFSPDGTMLAAADGSGRTYVWDVATHALIATLSEPGGSSLVAVAFSPDGKTLATGDGSGRTCLWHIAAS